MVIQNLASIYLLKVNNRNTKKKVWNMFKVNNKATKTTLILNIFHTFVLVFLLLTLSRSMPAGKLNLPMIALLSSLVTKLEWLALRYLFFQGAMFIHCINDDTFKSFKIHWLSLLYFLRNYVLKCLTIKALIIPVWNDIRSLLRHFRFEKCLSQFIEARLSSLKSWWICK